MNSGLADAYREDLAYIHDVGFDRYVLQSIPEILTILKSVQVPGDWVLDLGCGSGLSTQALVAAGYKVMGVDISAAMIAIARQRVPQATFKVDSLFKVELRPCRAAIAIGECLNYCFDPDNDAQTLQDFFRRVYAALCAEGFLIFDLLEANPPAETQPVQGFREGEDWLVLFEKIQNQAQTLLKRRIITFRQVGEAYRRDEEIHYQRLYPSSAIKDWLAAAGFVVTLADSYGIFQLPPHHRAFIARKPA
ncbi:MAG: methyltransferase domain-containing protein [Almyronema sp.]